MDLNAYFQSLKTYSESKQKTRDKFDLTGTLFDLTRKNNLGSVIVRPIMDSKSVPLKIMTNVYEIHETNYQTDANGQLVLDEYGKPIPTYTTIVVADPCNYTSSKLKLSMDQMEVLNKAIEASEKYFNYVNDGLLDSSDTPTNLWIKKCKEITMFYGKVLSVVNDAGAQDDGTTRFLVHKSAKFYKELCSSMEATTAARRDGGAWMSMYFDRTVGSSTRLLSVTTALNKPGTIGYTNTISFTEGAEYSLTDKDIATAEDIDSNPYCDITKFDSGVLTSLTERLNSYISKVDAMFIAQSGLVQAPQPDVTTIDNPPKVDDGFRIPTESSQVNTNPPIPPEFVPAAPSAQMGAPLVHEIPQMGTI